MKIVQPSVRSSMGFMHASTCFMIWRVMEYFTDISNFDRTLQEEAAGVVMRCNALQQCKGVANSV